MHLLFLSTEIDAVRGDGHAVVHLVACGHIELEVRAHGGLNGAIEPLLDLLPHFFVIVSCAELLVQLIVLRGINSLDRDHGGSRSLEDVTLPCGGSSCFASVIKS